MLKKKKKKNSSLKASLAEITSSLDNQKWFMDYDAFEHIISDCGRLDKIKGNSGGG